MTRDMGAGPRANPEQDPAQTGHGCKPNGKRQTKVGALAVMIISAAASLGSEEFRVEAGKRDNRLEAAPPEAWYAGVGFDYSQGDYGLAEATNIRTLYATARYRRGRGQASLTVPYLDVQGPGIGHESSAMAEASDTGSARGPGDITLRGRYDMWSQGELFLNAPALDLTGLVKFPTANEDDGLGTGQVDYGVGFGLFQPWGQYAYVADFEYRIRGSKSDHSLQNRFLYSIGAGRRIHERGAVYLFMDGGARRSENAHAPIELSIFGSWNLADFLSLQGYAGVGLSHGSPDQFTGISIRKSL